jgi:hypothetical protein
LDFSTKNKKKKKKKTKTKTKKISFILAVKVPAECVEGYNAHLIVKMHTFSLKALLYI